MVDITLRSAGSALTHTQLDNNFSNLNQFSSDGNGNTLFYGGTYSGSGSSNLIMGTLGQALTSGTDNVLVGLYAGDSITTGNFNVCIGRSSGTSITTNNRNVRIGYFAGWQYNSGDCTYIGSYAGGNASGNYNTYIGSEAGKTNFDSYNVCIGYAASQNMEGTNHVSIGAYALQGNTYYNNSNNNTAVGYAAAQLTYGYDYVTAFGDRAGLECGTYGTFLGAMSGYNSNAAYYSTFIGYGAGRNCQGQSNTCVGMQAGYYVTGQSNTFIGYNAGNSNTSATYYSGFYNTCIGKESQPSSATVSGECTIGAASGATEEITTFRIPGTGTTITTSLLAHGGDIAAYHSSDIRLKENIHVIPDALSKVNALRGVTYDWTAEALDMRKNPDLKWTQRKEDVGVIAQEVEKVLPELVLDRADGYKGIKYERLTALLIEAVKELSARVEELENGIS